MTDAPKHTAGPWETEPNVADGLTIGIRHEVRGGSLFLRIAHTTAIRSPLALKGRTPIEETEACAIGHLMGAAPELLEALHLTERNLSSLVAAMHSQAVLMEPWLVVVQAAIRKAEGR